ncbi:MAG: hypothetical protein WAM39_25505 [Bryobacteraceae bacterium]
MSDTIHVEGTRDSQTHSSKPLDEAVWHAWLKKNFLDERQRAAARIKAVKWACIGVLIVAAVVSSYVFTSYVSTYQAVVRFVIGLGAMVIMFESLRARQYAFTALFAAIVLLFNPLLPLFALSGNGLILFASVLPFVASLVWMKDRTWRVAVTAVPTSVLR